MPNDENMEEIVEKQEGEEINTLKVEDTVNQEEQSEKLFSQEELDKKIQKRIGKVERKSRRELAKKDEEIEKYIYQLNQIKDEMDKLTLVEIGSDDICISPTENTNVYRCDEYVNKEFDVTKNAPKSNGNYIEIKRFVND